ncbi:hypothetical protein E4O03_06555 [Treponema sp. OMZ 792]|uniref:hypothetical protein n=1 Tax=unclassified Treponema TaxID=2638727 RepID=UPI0020A3B7B0|nr:MULTISPECIES: hypothetical protein [unclassified Treponema]UTC76326.1 hypothetical protein E4O03_06555 [Treponema sp. OMZ 792]UTC80326.1 hypothetical protein E4O07_06445 [Treponema sp. OMZ 798]
MNNSNIEQIKKYLLLFAFFIAAGLILWGSGYIISGLKSDVYLQDADYILKKSPLCSEYQDVEFIKALNPSSLNMNFCNAVFEVRMKEKKGYAAFVNMSGKYGICQGMFLYFTEKCFFCGLGGGIADKPAMYYGITSLTIKVSEQKLESAFERLEIKNKEEK